MLDFCKQINLNKSINEYSQVHSKSRVFLKDGKVNGGMMNV
jgi:hypothetical protein